MIRRFVLLLLTTRTGRSMSMQTFQKILENPIYAGWATIPKWGLKFPGVFRANRQRVFDTVQDVLHGRRVVAKAYDHNNPDFPYASLYGAADAEHP